MKKLLFICLLLAGLPKVYPQDVALPLGQDWKFVRTDPSGSCFTGAQPQLNQATGDSWFCKEDGPTVATGVWTKTSGAGDGGDSDHATTADTLATPRNIGGVPFDGSAAISPLATGIVVTPAGNLASTDAGAAFNELDAEKQPLDAELTCIAGLTSAADRVPYYTGSGTCALAAVTSYLRSLLDDPDAATARATLALGNSATKDVGTSAGTVAAGDDSRLSDARQLPTSVYGSLPSASSNTNKVYLVTDCNAQNCTTGGGAFRVTMSSDGTSWKPSAGDGGSGGGATIASTGNLIKGDEAGNGISSGNPANCDAGYHPLGIDPTGDAEDCTADGGGGAFNVPSVVRTSSTELTIGPECTSSNPCNFRYGGTAVSLTASATVTISSGGGTAYIWPSTGGAWIVGHNIAGISCSGCTATSSVTSFPQVIPLYTWTATSGSWDISGGHNFQGQSREIVIAGTGIIVDDSGGQATVSVDPAYVGMGGDATPNLSATSVSAVTSLAINVTSAGLTSFNPGMLQCWSGTSTFSPVTITNYTLTGSSPITAVTPTFSSTANVRCVVNTSGATGPAGATGAAGMDGVDGADGADGATGPAGAGDVDGPSSATDNAISRFDGTTGKLTQNSSAILDDAGNLALAGSLALAEMTAPSGISSKAVLYTKSDHKLYVKLNNGSEDQVCTVATCAGGGGSPGGSPGQLQYNSSGSLAGIAGATTDGTVVTLNNPIITGELTLNQGTATTFTPSIYVSATWNNAAVRFFGDYREYTCTACTSDSALAVWRYNGAYPFVMNANGDLLTSGSMQTVNFFALGGSFRGLDGMGGQVTWLTGGDGLMDLTNAANTDFDRIRLGCTANTCPSIKKSGAGIEIRLADDSATSFLITKLPTSCSSLAAGVIWNNAGVVSVCP